MSAGSYYRLLRFRHIRRNGLALPKGFMFSRPKSTTQIVRDSIDDVTPEPEISAVFAKHSDGGSDVVLRSSDGMLFYANKTILILASSVFADILKEPPSSGISTSPPYEYPLPEDSQTISYLLQLSYPMEDPEIVDPCAMTTLSDAAVKYKMARATDYVKKWWKTNVHESTFETFSIAIKYDWSNLAKDAVAHGVTQVYDSYCPGMETVSAGIYRKYLQNRRRVRDSIWSFITKKRSGKGPAAQDKLQYWGHVSWESDLPKEFEWASTQTRRQESLQLYNAPAGFGEVLFGPSGEHIARRCRVALYSRASDTAPGVRMWNMTVRIAYASNHVPLAVADFSLVSGETFTCKGFCSTCFCVCSMKAQLFFSVLPMWPCSNSVNKLKN